MWPMVAILWSVETKRDEFCNCDQGSHAATLVNTQLKNIANQVIHYKITFYAGSQENSQMLRTYQTSLLV